MKGGGRAIQLHDDEVNRLNAISAAFQRRKKLANENGASRLNLSASTCPSRTSSAMIVDTNISNVGGGTYNINAEEILKIVLAEKQNAATSEEDGVGVLSAKEKQARDLAWMLQNRPRFRDLVVEVPFIDASCTGNNATEDAKAEDLRTNYEKNHTPKHRPNMMQNITNLVQCDNINSFYQNCLSADPSSDKSLSSSLLTNGSVGHSHQAVLLEQDVYSTSSITSHTTNTSRSGSSGLTSTSTGFGYQMSSLSSAHTYNDEGLGSIGSDTPPRSDSDDSVGAEISSKTSRSSSHHSAGSINNRSIKSTGSRSQITARLGCAQLGLPSPTNENELASMEIHQSECVNKNLSVGIIGSLRMKKSNSIKEFNGVMYLDQVLAVPCLHKARILLKPIPAKSYSSEIIRKDEYRIVHANASFTKLFKSKDNSNESELPSEANSS